MIKIGFITHGELEKIFHLFSNSFDGEILGQNGMRFEKSFKSYLYDHWLLCKDQTWFDMAYILYALMLNKNIIDKKNINYTEKSVAKS